MGVLIKNKKIGGTYLKKINIMSIANYIDHTALKPDTTEKQIRQLCLEAKEYSFKSVCVNPCWVTLCAELLADTEVEVCTVIGFPLGANKSETKANEAKLAVTDGATEVDMVLNVGELKSKNVTLVEREIQGVREAVPDTTLKVIIETCLLTDEEKILACQICKKVGTDFVKTSTGFSTGGATVEDIVLMRKTVGSQMGVKASGGIRSFEDAQAMIKAGATRLGCSAGIEIVKNEK